MFAYNMYYIGILINDSGFVLHCTAHTGIRLIRGRIEMFSLTGMFYMGGKKDKRICCVCVRAVSSRRVDAAAVVAPIGTEILLLYIAATSESPNGTYLLYNNNMYKYCNINK